MDRSGNCRPALTESWLTRFMFRFPAPQRPTDGSCSTLMDWASKLVTGCLEQAVLSSSRITKYDTQNGMMPIKNGILVKRSRK